MNVRAAFLIGLFLFAGFARGDEFSGIYVNKNHNSKRIEFMDHGRYMASYPKEEGACTIEKDACVCRCDGEIKYQFRRQGDMLIDLIDEEDNEWLPREQLAKMPWKAVTPVTIVVLESDTRKPIARYSYTYSISTPEAEYNPLWVRPGEVNSPRGEFTVLAPAACKIDVRISGEGIVGGFGRGGGDYPLTSDNKLRRIEVTVATGVTIEGVVVDAKTGRPIRDAVVSPIIFCPPLFTADPDHTVKTDAEGKFVIGGVEYDMGISVWHSDYFEFNSGGFEKAGKKIAEKRYSAKIELTAGESLFGIVHDPAGKPLPGVAVSDGAGKCVRTNSDGKFALASPKKWGGNDTYQISFEKKGYLDNEINPTAADPKGFDVTLEPRPTLVGQVFGPDGRLVQNYQVAAAVGLEPPAYSCWDSKAKVSDPQGRFSLTVDTSHDWDKVGKVWVGVKSPDFALWETSVDVWKGEKSLAVRLASGVSVCGSVIGRKGLGGDLSVTLLPCRTRKKETVNPDDLSKRQEMGRLKTSADADGKFRFEHVLPGSYRLLISGPSISPIGSIVSVADKDADIGEFCPVGKGCIVGIVYEPTMICEGNTCRMDQSRKPWKFVGGFISCPDLTGQGKPQIPFKTDEHGRFRVEGVPVGIVRLGINYHITADIIGTHARSANVVEGKTTEVRFFDTSGDWDVCCKPVVGDGSPEQFAVAAGMTARRKVDNVTTRPPMFIISLKAKDDVPGSFSDSSDWQELEKDGKITLPDVQPGKYRLTVMDWQGSRGMFGTIYEKDIETTKSGTTLLCPLGTGSITGGVRWSKPCRRMVHVVAVGKQSGTIRHAYCDDSGNFCMRYLPADQYQLFAHDHDAGWAKLAAAQVENNTSDIGELTLTSGGTIKGQLPARWAGDVSVIVTAVSPEGVFVASTEQNETGNKTFEFFNLWPGKWTVKLFKNERVLAEKTIELRYTETTRCDLEQP